MTFKPIKIISATALTMSLFCSCNNGPKVVEASSKEELSNAKGNPFQIDPKIEVRPSTNDPFGNAFHQVRVNEVLPTSRYVYLQVDEAGKSFWIATRKMEVAVGETYFYQGGLLKTMFESKEYDRMFDTIYLVSNLVSSDHSKHVQGNTSPNSPTLTAEVKEDIPMHTDENIVHKGTVRIADVVKNPQKYEGHTIQVKGVCTKINPNIMNRNWIHIKDGSQDEYDMVVTTNSYVPEGKEFMMRAVVHLNRDFGAGYAYDLILEDGILIE